MSSVKETVKNTSSFVKELISRLKGDDVEVLAEKNYRKAKSAINSQINLLEGRIVDEEDKVSDAEEALKVAIIPDRLISDNQSYISGIASAQRKLLNAKEEHENVKESLAFFKAILVEQF